MGLEKFLKTVLVGALMMWPIGCCRSNAVCSDLTRRKMRPTWWLFLITARLTALSEHRSP